MLKTLFFPRSTTCRSAASSTRAARCESQWLLGVSCSWRIMVLCSPDAARRARRAAPRCGCDRAAARALLEQRAVWLVAQAKRFTRCGPKANDSAARSGSDWRTGELGNWSTQASRAVKLNLVGEGWRTPKLRELNNWRPRRPDYPAVGGRPSTRNSRTVPVDQLGIQAREMPEDWPNCTSPELRQLLAPTDPRSSSLSVPRLKNSWTVARDWQFARRLEAGSNWPNCTSPELRQLLEPTDPRSSSLSVPGLKNSRTGARDWKFARRLEAGSNCPD